MDAPIRVLIFHPTRFLADALRLLLEDWQRLVLRAASDPVEARGLIEEEAVDIILLYATAESDRAVRDIKKWRPEQRVVVLGQEDCLEEIVRLIEAGAAGYLLQDASPGDIAHMIEATYDERPLWSPRVVAAVFSRVSELARTVDTPPVADKLSAREQQILGLLGLGLANKEIARSLDIELCTVKNHVHRILEKLSARSRREAVRLACASGVVQAG